MGRDIGGSTGVKMGIPLNTVAPTQFASPTGHNWIYV